MAPMGDHPGANSTFAAPQDDGMSVTAAYFDKLVISAALERWIDQFGQQSCAEVPEQRGEYRRAG
jgi:hypothetical protein